MTSRRPRAAARTLLLRSIVGGSRLHRRRAVAVSSLLAASVAVPRARVEHEVNAVLSAASIERVEVEPESARVWRVLPLPEGPLGSVELAWRTTDDDPLNALGRTPLARPRPAGMARGRAPAAPPPVPLWQRLAAVLRPSAELLLATGGPLAWPASLFAYQLDGVRTLLDRDAVLLADDLGLGKTVQAIAALRILLVQHRVENSLVVVPASLVDQWRAAFRTWAPEVRISTVRGVAADRAWQWQTPAHVYLASYETVREDLAADRSSGAGRPRAWGVVVLDEAQRIKNRDAAVSRTCKALVRRRAWALSGTPLENGLDDLASILEFVTPHGGTGRGERLYPGADLAARHTALQLRRRKSDVLADLPPKLNAQVLVTLGPAQRAAYERAERDGIVELHARGAALRTEHVLVLLTRLKQLCNVDPVSGQSAKLADLRERLAALVAEGHRALVFTQFTDAVFGARGLADRLAEFRPLVYTGDVPSAERDGVVRTFHADPLRRVLILSLRAGGVGLNLQDASYVFHFDRWWNPAVERQAEDRSHRIGQTLPVHVYAYVCANTVEERIAAILQRKQVLFDEVVDNVSLDLSRVLTSDELFGLFGLR